MRPPRRRIPNIGERRMRAHSRTGYIAAGCPLNVKGGPNAAISTNSHFDQISKPNPHQGQLRRYPKTTAPVEKMPAIDGCGLALRVSPAGVGLLLRAHLNNQESARLRQQRNSKSGERIAPIKT